MNRLLKKRIFLLAVVALSSVATYGQIRWLSTVHDFGTFSETLGPVSCTFQGVNTGSEPIAVTDCRANCGCTTPIYTRGPIAPGDTLTVKVTYNPSQRPGRFHKQVRVTTNTEPATQVLSIRGTVIGSDQTISMRYPQACGKMRYSSNIISFGETTQGHVLAGALNIYNSTTDTVIPAVADLPPYINVVFSPKVIPPGEMSVVSFTAYTGRQNGLGLVEDSFKLIPDSKFPEYQAEISTVMTVNEDFSRLTDKERSEAPVARLSTQSLNFAVIDTASTAEQTFTITNLGKSPLTIRRLYSLHKAIKLSNKPGAIRPGKSVTIKVKVDPTLIPDKLLNTKIIVITNDPINPSQSIRAVGII